MAQFHGTPHGIKQFLLVPWFGNEIDGSSLNGPHRFLRVHIGSNKQHHALRIVLQYPAEPFIALLAADGIPTEIHVKQDNIGRESVHELDDALRLADDSHSLHMRLQEHIERQEHILVVVYYKYLSFHILSSPSVNFFIRTPASWQKYHPQLHK